MTVWPQYDLFFDAQDKLHVEDALEMAGRLHIHYVPAASPDVYLEFVNGRDATIFKIAYTKTILNVDNTAKLANVASLASISDTLDALSPETKAGLCIEADLWCRDQATKHAYNAALAALSGRFVGPLPTI